MTCATDRRHPCAPQRDPAGGGQPRRAQARWPAAVALAACTAAAVAASAAHAADLTAVRTLSAPEFRALAEDLAAVAAWRAAVPAEPSGVTGFDLGLHGGAVTLGQRAAWSRAAGGAAVDRAPALAAVHVVKGLPWNVDIGAHALALADGGVRGAGAELRWAFVPGGVVSPALALRLSAGRIGGVADLSLSTWGADVAISKGFALFTPYAGAGVIGVRADGAATAAAAAQRERFTQGRAYVGVNIGLTPLALALQADRTGGATAVTAKLALRW